MERTLSDKATWKVSYTLDGSDREKYTIKKNTGNLA